MIFRGLHLFSFVPNMLNKIETRSQGSPEVPECYKQSIERKAAIHPRTQRFKMELRIRRTTGKDGGTHVSFPKDFNWSKRAVWNTLLEQFCPELGDRSPLGLGPDSPLQTPCAAFHPPINAAW